MPKKPVRIGESWQTPKSDLTRQFCQGPAWGAKFTGKGFQKLAKIEFVDGVKCAKIIGSFSGVLSGKDPKAFKVRTGSEKIRIRGSVIWWFALDGYLKKSIVNTKIAWFRAGPVGGKTVLNWDHHVATTGAIKRTGAPGKSKAKVKASKK